MPATRITRGTSFLPFTPTFSREANDLENRITKFMREPLSTFFTPDLPNFFMPQTFIGWAPPVEISETQTEFMVKAELPGMLKKDLSIEYEKGLLTISGEKFEEKKEGDNRRYHLVERNFGSFNRSFTFPEFVDPEKISAEFKDGILMIHLPKTEEAMKPRGKKIEILDKI